MDAAAFLHGPGAPDGIPVNDVHAALSPARVARGVAPASIEEVRAAVRWAAGADLPVCVAGGRHAMGGQPFAGDALLLDMRRLDRIIALDHERGEAEVEAGIMWPALLDGLDALQQGDPGRWSIIQKQTGADRLTIGGALAANIHGRGLRFAPIVQDVAAFTLVDASGALRRCSREENAGLFLAPSAGTGCSAWWSRCGSGCSAATRSSGSSRWPTRRPCPTGSRTGSPPGSPMAISSSTSTPLATGSCAAAFSPATGRSPMSARSPPGNGRSPRRTGSG
ncbi:MAG: FAD-binding protein [Chloroflexota bacterium]